MLKVVIILLQQKKRQTWFSEVACEELCLSLELLSIEHRNSIKRSSHLLTQLNLEKLSFSIQAPRG